MHEKRAETNCTEPDEESFRKEKEQADNWLTQHMLQSRAYQEAKVIATYLSMPHEVSTADFIKQAQLDGKRF